MSNVGNVMLQTGIAALEHARDLRVKVGVSELQAQALLEELAELQRIKALLIQLKTCDEHDMDRLYFELLALVPEVA